MVAGIGYEFTINFPTCGHSGKYTSTTRQEMQEIAKSLIEKELGLCGKCYYEYCKKHNIKPWYSKSSSEDIMNY